MPAVGTAGAQHQSSTAVILPYRRYFREAFAIFHIVYFGPLAYILCAHAHAVTAGLPSITSYFGLPLAHRPAPLPAAEDAQNSSPFSNSPSKPSK